MKNITPVIALCVASGLSGCSTIQSWFPDKEKDYQFTSELPPLVIPPDLMHKAKTPSRVTALPPVLEKTPELPVSVAKQPIDNRQPVNTETIPLNRDDIQLTRSDDKTSQFSLNVPYERAFRIVGKAIGRSGIEVLERNEEAKTIKIQVTQAPTAPVEKSFLDETLSMFDIFEADEKIYVIEFLQNGNDQTSATLLSSNLKPLTQSNTVFRRLYDSIQTDLRK
jgi:outer membrane protein assembly factor BamC